MKYLALVYFEETEIAKLTQREWDDMNLHCLEFNDEIARSGHRLGGEALEPTHTATTVRVRNGKVQTVDGPFAETREQLAGFYFFEAKDLDEALAIAARIPPAKYGSIEVRPVRELKSEGQNSR
jgi:hypothetical protein